MSSAAGGRAEADGGQGVGQASNADLQTAQGRRVFDQWQEEVLDGRVPEQKRYFAIIGLKLLHRSSEVVELLFIIRKCVESSDKLALKLLRDVRSPGRR